MAYEKCTPVKGGKRGVGVHKEWRWGGKGTRQRPGLRKCTPVKRGKSGVGVQKEWRWGGKRARCRPDLRKMYAGEERQERSGRAKGVELERKKDKAEAWPTKNVRR